MKLPLIVVNFKTYPSALGIKALELAKIHAKVAKDTGANIAVAVQTVDLRMIATEVDIPVFSQHFELAEQGSFTGHVTPYSLVDAGAAGTLLNHAEKKLPLDVLQKSIEKAAALGLFTIVCADTAESGQKYAKFNPDLVAVEPPELIGGDISVTSANPQIVKDAVAMIGKNKVLVGAGVKTGEDVKMAIQYGASGVLLASGIIKSTDPERTLRDLVSGLH